MANFTVFSNLVLRLEGGYQNHPSDKGNYNSLGQLVGTNLGISAPVYENWINRPPSAMDMKAIDKATANAIYKVLYWDKVKGDAMKTQELANLIADHAVNAGTGSAGKIVQRVLNTHFGSRLAVDGVIGNLTISDVNAVNQSKLFDAILAARERFYKSLNQPAFLQGWLHRLRPFYEDAMQLAQRYAKPVGFSLLVVSTIGFGTFFFN